MSMIRSVLEVPPITMTKATQFAQMNMLNDTQYLTNDEAAGFLKLSPRTLEKLRVLGTGPRFRKLGRRVIYDAADLVSWCNERVFERTTHPS
jgi:predicted DNA-binding transcriptional regulator AlpA